MSPRSNKYPDHLLDSFKALYEPRYKRPLSDFEAEDAMNNLIGAGRVLSEWARKDRERKERGEPAPVPPPPYKTPPKKNRKKPPAGSTSEG